MNWKPNKWIAVALNLFALPLGMFYLTRPVWALFYLLGFVLFIIVFVYQPIELKLWWAAIIMPVSAIHSYILASRDKPIITRPRYSRWYGLILIYVLTLSIVFSLRAFIYDFYSMPATSMYPTMNSGSHIIVSKWGYGNYGAFGITAITKEPEKTIARGDVLVFAYPRDTSQYYVKRVVGLPGDHIAYYNKKLYVNKSPVALVPVRSDNNFEIYQETVGTTTYQISHMPERPSNLEGETNVPQNQYYVLGDNRDNSNDSRVWGFVPQENIVGKVVKVIN